MTSKSEIIKNIIKNGFTCFSCKHIDYTIIESEQVPVCLFNRTMNPEAICINFEYEPGSDEKFDLVK